jgi:hypothetical protein
MNKKIILIFFILVILFIVTVIYGYYTRLSTEEERYTNPVGAINDDDVSEEIDDVFIDEEDEIEIGDMV